MYSRDFSIGHCRILISGNGDSTLIQPLLQAFAAGSPKCVSDFREKPMYTPPLYHVFLGAPLNCHFEIVESFPKRGPE